MASILDRYGIKEVADVTFYTIDGNTGKPDKPVLYLDTLKVSTVEQTAENVYAQGGKGNAKLIGWDFGKEITLNLEDALFSPKSMSLLFGNGSIGTVNKVKKTITFKETKPEKWEDAQGKLQAIPTGAKVYKADGSEHTEGTFEKGETYFLTFDVDVAGKEIVVGPNTFPGTYYITGDTYARSEATGLDQYFQFIVPKGKITSENTITMEAEGDPSVFNMTVEVMRASLQNDDGTTENVMMKLVQYDLETTES